jgi:hypothetical protein
VSKLEPYIPFEYPPENLKLKFLISKISTENREIACFDGILHCLSNSDFLLAPLTSKEKVLSSGIEGTQATFNLYTQMKEKFIHATRSQYAIPALDAFFRQPILSTTNFIQMAGLPNRITANNIIKSLLDAGLIRLYRPSEGRRPAEYVFDSIIKIVEGRDDDFV